MHDTLFLGRIEVRPPLNESERDYLADLVRSTSTLRGTPTGRGDTSVPFAHLAWEPCESGCCLTWSGQERSSHMQVTLRFVVDHLLRRGAKAGGHKDFGDFTCDHVLDGTVMGARYDDEQVHVIDVVGNTVAARSLDQPCEGTAQSPQASICPQPLPDNVFELHPREA
ncbi:hypothetical protein [Nocardioides sp.]|uniref:hypothetical protein n=1 Tax=Nocardioides sp. TaxID=35761 RepID=UPI002B5F32E0|nr:hypothetical protein [Nocardioides sp.]HXH78971.1 hypothetical protein [Nocardioides sp.]